MFPTKSRVGLLSSAVAVTVLLGSTLAVAQGAGGSERGGAASGGAAGGAERGTGGAERGAAPAARPAGGTPERGAEAPSGAAREGAGGNGSGVAQGAKPGPASGEREAPASRERGGPAGERNTPAAGDRSPSRGETRGEAGRGEGGRGGHVELSGEKRTRFTSVIRERHVEALHGVDFRVGVGTVIPERYHFYPLPASIIELVPEYRGYDYIVVDGEIIILEPGTRRIVDVIQE